MTDSQIHDAIAKDLATAGVPEADRPAMVSKLLEFKFAEFVGDDGNSPAFKVDGNILTATECYLAISTSPPKVEGPRPIHALSTEEYMTQRAKGFPVPGEENSTATYIARRKEAIERGDRTRGPNY